MLASQAPQSPSKRQSKVMQTLLSAIFVADTSACVILAGALAHSLTAYFTVKDTLTPAGFALPGWSSVGQFVW